MTFAISVPVPIPIQIPMPMFTNGHKLTNQSKKIKTLQLLQKLLKIQLKNKYLISLKNSFFFRHNNFRISCHAGTTRDTFFHKLGRSDSNTQHSLKNAHFLFKKDPLSKFIPTSTNLACYSTNILLQTFLQNLLSLACTRAPVSRCWTKLQRRYFQFPDFWSKPL